METARLTTCSFSWSNNHLALIRPSYQRFVHSTIQKGQSKIRVTAEHPRENCHVHGETEKAAGYLQRRLLLVSGFTLTSSAVLGFAKDGLAVVKQGLLAGRVPGLSEPDEQGWFFQRARISHSFFISDISYCYSISLSRICSQVSIN